VTRIERSGHGKIIVGSRQFEQEAGITFPFLISTTKKFRDEHPDTVQKVLNVYSKANKYIREHHDEAVKIFTDAAKARGAKLTEDLVKVMLFDTDRFGGSAFTDADMTDLAATRAFLTKIGKIKSPPPLDTVIDRSFGKKSEMALMN
jgi:ABC-type nitrate/sulfonate/bicarbonate transport system substrate-binding protein